MAGLLVWLAFSRFNCWIRDAYVWYEVKMAQFFPLLFRNSCNRKFQKTFHFCLSALCLSHTHVHTQMQTLPPLSQPRDEFYIFITLVIFIIFWKIWAFASKSHSIHPKHLHNLILSDTNQEDKPFTWWVTRAHTSLNSNLIQALSTFNYHKEYSVWSRLQCYEGCQTHHSLTECSKP